MERKGREAGLLGDFVESTVAIVTMQQQRFSKARTSLQGVDLWIDVAVSDENIEPGVIVHIKKAGAPAYKRVAGLSDAGSPAHVVESLLAHIAIERVGLLLKMRDEETEAAAVVVIAPVYSHVAELHSFAAESYAGNHPHVRKGAVVVVVVEIVGNGIVGDQEVRPAIVVVIDPHDAEAVVADLIMDAGLDGNFLKGAVAAIVIEEVALPLQAPGTALHQDAFEAAELIAAELRQVVHVQMGVARDIKIDEAVAVVVAPSLASHESAAADSCFFGDILELAVAEPVIEGAAAEAGHEEVQLAVVVIIGDGYSHTPAAVRQPRFLGDVFESPVGLLVIESDERIASSTEALHCGTVDQDDVEAAIVIAIE